MWILDNGRWTGDYLDYDVQPGEAGIDCRLWCHIGPVDDQYFIPRRSLALLWNYLKHVGVRALAHKIRSRYRERRRNAKFAAVGIGECKLANNCSKIRVGQTVVFFAYNHPQCASRISIDERFVSDCSEINFSAQDELMFCSAGSDLPGAQSLMEYAGWSPYSGVTADSGVIERALSQISDHLRLLIKRGGCEQKLTASHGSWRSAIKATSTQVGNATGQLSAVLFGLGNYAKTCILPNVDRRVRIARIHEIDPVQIGVTRSDAISYDTSPVPRSFENFDVYFIAGYHHLHTPIALHALANGAYAVVEKPVATTMEDLASLQRANAERRMFACFQRRYHSFNDLARTDLKVSEGEAINYHAVIYECCLPERHWYRWPESKSRLTSNGCHWIDHFLFLNHYSPVIAQSVFQVGRGDVAVNLELANGAMFTMALSDCGSSRLGVREYVELRANNVTVKITDASSYVSEDKDRILRRQSVNPMLAYRTMYRTITERIANHKDGDSPESLSSAAVTIGLEQIVTEEIRRRNSKAEASRLQGAQAV
jgi:predicted dehydrogenase